jgi:phage/plasmid-associated DNA primase
MITNTDLSVLYETCYQWKALVKEFLDNERYVIPNGSPEANITDQCRGRVYHIPFNINGFAGRTEGNMELSMELQESKFDIQSLMGKSGSSSEYVIKNAFTPLDIFFQYVEACRLANVPMYLSERQYLIVPKKKKELEVIDANWSSPDYQEVRPDLDSPDSCDDDEDLFNEVVDIGAEVDELDVPPDEEFDVESLARNLLLEKSGIELDFDIYQRSDTRQINDAAYWTLAQQIFIILASTLNIQPNMPNGMTDDNYLYTYAVILRKPNVVFVSHSKHGDCYKDSFHLRIPGIKVSREYKLFLMDRMIKDNVLGIGMSCVTTLINSHRDVLDVGSARYPAMLLGSMKNGGKEPHQFYMLLRAQVSITTPHPFVHLDQVSDFDPVVDPNETTKIKHPTKKGNYKMNVRPNPEYRYNLTHECSLLYEAPRGLIKKHEFEPVSELAHELRLLRERKALNGNSDDLHLVNEMEITAVQNAVETICNRSFEAAYIKELLDILDHSRTSEYQAWRNVVCALAWESHEYKPLAIWFSLRNQEAWIKDGAGHLEQNWQWALSRPRDVNNPDEISVKSIEAWARQDNYEAYNRIQKYNAMSILSAIATEEDGDLPEDSVADLLLAMFGSKFATDEDPLSGAKGSDMKWFEFVYPEDVKSSDLVRGFVYKWRSEKIPTGLYDYITSKDKLKMFFTKYINYNKERIERAIIQIQEYESTGNATGVEVERIKRRIEYYEKLNANIRKTKKRLGKKRFIFDVLDCCKMKFRRRGFMEVLDQNPDVFGVANGVLRLRPETELIQRYHEIPITRCSQVDYEPYNPNNPIVRETEEAIKRAFVTPEGEFDEESYEFNMMFLASSLDGHKKAPIFMIWEGDGSGGKSTLTELHLGTLGRVTKGGYGNKMNTDFFTMKSKGGTGADSEKMSMKFSRYNYASETAHGDALQMSKIKEFTGGENIASRELFGKHDVFEPNGIYLLITNFELTIHGSDYGTWRRILRTVFRRKFRAQLDPTDPLVMIADPKWIRASKDPQYQKAYLSILVKFYEKLRDEYSNDITKVPHKRILEETQKYRDEQDVYSEFMSKQSVYIGKIYPGTTREVKRIPLQEISEKFKKWYAMNKGDKQPMSSEVLENLRRSIDGKYMREINGRRYLVEHYIMSANEEFNLEEVVEKIKQDEAMNDLSGNTGYDANAEDLPEDFVEDFVEDLPEDLPDDAVGDDIAMPDDLMDDLDAEDYGTIENLDNIEAPDDLSDDLTDDAEKSDVGDAGDAGDADADDDWDDLDDLEL